MAAMTEENDQASRPRGWARRTAGWVVPVLVVAAGVAAFQYLKSSRPSSPPATPEERVWQVDVVDVAPGRHHPRLPLHGQITSPDRLQVSAPATARIDRLPVRDGQAVSEGELLVAFDPADFEPAVRAARATLADVEAQIERERQGHEFDRSALEMEKAIVENARRTLERSRSLSERDLASSSDVDNARDALNQAQLARNSREQAIETFPARLASLEASRESAAAELARAERDLARATARAPFDGIIGSVTATAGDQVAANTDVLEIYSLESLELRATIPARHANELLGRDSDQATTASARHGGKMLDLTLARFAGEASGEGLTAIFTFDEPPASLRLGDVLRLDVARPARDGSVPVPYSALYGNNRVYRVVDGRLERVEVTVLGDHRGSGEGRWVLVESPALRPGDRIATTHLPNAIDGLKVEPRGEAADRDAS
ncbi:MAG: efflux RND transporter periplasmic adaptor subunit [Guyparkeria sp.]|uniref:efflux RND transporter periplasmic adaptor subunit n=1 Tax=Guyparkeria sp. TaxID=2035736 RepID=UPI003979010D